MFFVFRKKDNKKRGGTQQKQTSKLKRPKKITTKNQQPEYQKNYYVKIKNWGETKKTQKKL